MEENEKLATDLHKTNTDKKRIFLIVCEKSVSVCGKKPKELKE